MSVPNPQISFQRDRLTNIARISIQNEATAAILIANPVQDQFVNKIVSDQSSCVDDRFRL
jgi:hypothetical protein